MVLNFLFYVSLSQKAWNVALSLLQTTLYIVCERTEAELWVGGGTEEYLRTVETLTYDE